MGALAPLTHWLPQDDLLLKNAVEAGASLEALAKGAVKFSRRFTLQELQNRWYSLLYDPVVAEEASGYMIDVSTAQSNKIENGKEDKCTSGKRKPESVRKCFYAMRKRICDEPFYPIDFNSVGGPGYGNAGNELISIDRLITDQVSDYNSSQERNFVAENGSLVELAMYAANLEAQHQHMFGRTNDKEATTCSGSECQVINSSPSDCLNSLQRVGYSSLPQVPIVDTANSVSDSTIKNVLVNDAPHTEDDLQIPDGGGSPNNGQGYCSMPFKSELGDQTTCVNMMELPPNAEEHFSEQLTCGNYEDLAPNAEDYYEQLINFTPEDELLFADANGKEIMDSLSSLLSDYFDENDVQNVGLSEASVAPQECSNISIIAHHEESRNEKDYHCGDQQQVWSAVTQKLSSALTVNPMYPELRNGVVCCTLNSEDTEVPDNDDVFLPIWIPSTSISWMESTRSDEIYYPVPSSVMELSHDRENIDIGMMRGGRRNHTESDVPNQVTEQFPSEIFSNHHVNDSGLRFQLPCVDVQRVIGTTSTSECLKYANITHADEMDTTPGTLNESLEKVEQADELNDKYADSHDQKHVEDLDTRLTFQKNAFVRKQDADCTSINQKDDAIHRDLFSTTMNSPEKSVNCALEDFSGDGEVPYSSDVEAMVLDMDLIPDDPDLCNSPGVLKYQNEGARRRILRLEQAAETFLQRSMAAEGAFAVLYGRYSKYFIKKREVLIGRGTEDVKVDIDLGREARASKISRQQTFTFVSLGEEKKQILGFVAKISKNGINMTGRTFKATLKLESDGSFHLRNIGKSLIFVNGKEIMPGQTVSLISSCLVEIKGTALIFETNKKLCKAVV